MTDEWIGKTINGYEYLEVIGRGGMATVYRAHQISMNRIVAVKVLPKQYIHDDTYLQRFEQEVKIVSQLEHRNIVPVHDYGEYEGQPYIVMRYMPAGSVDDLLNHGPLELEQIVNILDQIAPALDYAHSKHVLHRDLKPSNVLLDEAGGAYLTDFGIARILSEGMGKNITTQGVVGTPSYMSPEQAQGLPLDNRSDIYALGVMLFEMATGRRPFESDTPYGVAVMQVTSPPPSPRKYNPALSFAAEEVILKALKKKREERYPHAVALSEALKRALDKPVTSIHDTQPALPRPQPRPAVPLQSVPPAPPAPRQNMFGFSPSPPSAESPAGLGMRPRAAARAPDYASRSSSILSRPKSNSKVRAAYPRHRPRTNPWLNAAVGGAIGCGVLMVLVILVLIILANLLAADGQPVITPPPADLSSPGAHSWAIQQSLLPTAIDLAAAAIAPVGAPPTRTPDPGLRQIGGSLVYFAERDQGVHLYRLDLATGVETQLTFSSGVDSFPAISPDGRFIAFQSDRDRTFDIYVMDTEGRNLRQLTRNQRANRLPAWSPDGAWIAFALDTRGDGAFDLYRVRPDGSDLQPLLTGADRASQPRYSPDGRSLVFTTGDPHDASTWEIARLDLASGDVRQLTNNAVKDWSPSYSPDGSSILYLTADGAKGGVAIARMNADGREARVLFDGPGYEWGPAYSPDGQHIVFTAAVGEANREQLYLIRADGSGLRQVTASGGQGAVWLSAVAAAASPTSQP